MTCLVCLGLVVALCHERIPDRFGIMLMVETLLPWCTAGLFVLATLALTLTVRWHTMMSTVITATLAVITLPLLPSVGQPSAHSVTPALEVFSQNIRAGNAELEEMATTVADVNADIVVLQEITPRAAEVITESLGPRYQYAFRAGTVAIWSTLPLHDVTGLDLGLGWQRGIRADVVVDTATGTDVWRIYSVHIASVRPGVRTTRDTSLTALDDVIEAESSPNILLVGDFNAASHDRAFRPLLDHLAEVTPRGALTPYTWPAAFPVTQLDHALVRTDRYVLTAATTPGLGSDHRGILTTAYRSDQ